MRPAAVIFDIDGTLMDDEQATTDALAAFHRTLGNGCPLSICQLQMRWRELLDRHFARYLKGEVTLQEQRRARLRELFQVRTLDVAAADGLYRAYESAYRASWRAYPDAEPCLGALNGLPLGVLSNGDQRQQTDKLAAAGISHHFSVICTSSLLGSAKPSRTAFLEVCARLNAAPEHCVYVGDNLNVDARGSASAGLRSVWLDRYNTGIHPGDGIRVIRTLAEIR